MFIQHVDVMLIPNKGNSQSDRTTGIVSGYDGQAVRLTKLEAQPAMNIPQTEVAGRVIAFDHVLHLSQLLSLIPLP